MNNTISQRRSDFALTQLKQTGVSKDFATLTAGLPAMILQNGFGHTLAFLLSKGTDKHLQAVDIIARWLEKQKILQSADREKAVFSISKMSQAEYLRGQQEALMILEWVKRYANSGLFSEERR